MTRRVYSTEAERLVAEREALRDAARTGAYLAPQHVDDAAAEARRYHPANFGVRRPSAPESQTPGVSAEEVAEIVREAMGGADPQAAQGKVARDLQALGADSTTVNLQMRRVFEAVTRQAGRVGNLAGAVAAAGDRRAAAALARRRAGPFDGGTIR